MCATHKPSSFRQLVECSWCILDVSRETCFGAGHPELSSTCGASKEAGCGSAVSENRPLLHAVGLTRSSARGTSCTPSAFSSPACAANCPGTSQANGASAAPLRLRNSCWGATRRLLCATGMKAAADSCRACWGLRPSLSRCCRTASVTLLKGSAASGHVASSSSPPSCPTWTYVSKGLTTHSADNSSSRQHHV
jgi:hypothetical protein